MKVYTATFISENYGSLLQAYALQKKIKELGATPIIVGKPIQKRCSGDILRSRFKTFFKHEEHYGLVRKMRRSIERRIYIEKRKKTTDFVNKYLTIEPYWNCVTQLQYEKSICLAGSDQIWNILNGPINGFYLFDYVNKDNHKLCSYAASIGLEVLTEEQKLYYRAALQHFDAISFREKVAYDLLSGYLDNAIIRNDIDPTLFYSKNLWSCLVGNKIENQPYIFVYMLRPDKKLIRMAKLLEKETKYKVVFLGQFNDFHFGWKTLTSAGVEDFLSAIANAEMVLTNSFHCTVFSVLFEKKFLSVKIDSTSSRVDNLLRMLGLEHHLIDNVESINQIYDEYDSTAVEILLNEERARSESYLKSIINFD